MNIEPGIYPDISHDDYHNGPGISSSGIKNLARSAAHYREYRDNPAKRTPALTTGDAFHCLTLTPDDFDKRFIVKPAVARRKQVDKGFWAQWETDNADKIWLTQGELDLANRLRDAVISHPTARTLLESGTPEQSVYWRDPETKVLCKCRHDWYSDSHNAIVDLKSAVNASKSAFQRAINTYLYHVSFAFYFDGTHAAGLLCERYAWVVVEKTAPFSVAIYSPESEWLEYGRMVYRGALRRFVECLKTKEWPAYPLEVRSLEMPGYAKYTPEY